MFFFSFYIFKKLLKSIVFVFLISWSLSLAASQTKPEDILILLDSADAELADSLT